MLEPYVMTLGIIMSLATREISCCLKMITVMLKAIRHINMRLLGPIGEECYH